MAKKLTNSQAALSHAKAYVQEIGYYDKHPEIVDQVQSIKSVKEFRTFITKGRSGEYYIERILHYYPVESFYQAMLKVCPLLGKHPDHSGTEDRGWWRVYGAVKRKDGYFCDLDMGRDQWMAETFVKAGAFSQQEYDWYKTNLTLKMMTRDRWQTNGFPDVVKIKAAWKEEYHHRVLDMRLIAMLEAA